MYPTRPKYKIHPESIDKVAQGHQSLLPQCALKFWKLASGEALQHPLPALLAIFLAVRLSVDCARMLMWR